MKNTITEELKSMVDVNKEAFTGLRDAVGIPNPEVQFYNKMQNEDFQAIVDKFGEPRAMKFIKDMEIKRMKGR